MSTLFVRAANPIWFMVDLTGQPLNDQYYAFFLANTLPYNFQNVFQDENRSVVWANPLQFQPSGTLPNNLYFDPSLVYRIEIRKGPTQADPLIGLIENFVPGVGSTPLPPGVATDFIGSQNLITDPQFADINFANNSINPYTITVAGTYNIAPGWNLVLTGGGTTTIQQLALPGNSAIAGNPPFALDINNSGWATATLVQTFTNNGAIFSGGSVSASLLVRSYTTPQTISVNYIQSPPGTVTNIIMPTASPIGIFTTVSGVADIPASTNTNTGAAATVQFAITLPNTGQLDLTNIQFLGQSIPLTSSSVAAPLFQQITYEQTVNQEFYLYMNSLLTQPKNSLLAGWNFGLNPWQFTNPAGANLANNAYTADQTIVIQQNYVTNVANTNNIFVGQDSVANNYGLKVVPVTAHNQFAILQWIDPSTIRPYWKSKLSSMVKAALTTTHATSVRFKMRLIYKAGLPNTTAQNDPIATWVESADPQAAAGYTLIAPLNDPAYVLGTSSANYAFDQFQLPASSDPNMTLGVLLYTIDNMNQNATADFLTINDVSLVDNDFAIQTQPDTFDEALRKCQFYFEKSYNQGTLITDADTVGVSSTVTTDVAQTQMSGMDRIFKVTKRKTPVVTWYSPQTGTAARIYDVTDAAEKTVSATTYTGEINTGYPNITAPGNLKVLIGHWTAGARIGIASET